MVSDAGRTKELKVSCRLCNTTYSLLVNPNNIIEWQAGGFIQDVMSYLSADERELLISRTCGECWKNMFGSEEDLETEN